MRVAPISVVCVVMRMAMNPERNTAGADERLQIRGKRGIRYAPDISRRNGPGTRRVMSDDHSFLGGVLIELRLQPGDGGLMKLDCVLGAQPTGGGSYHLEIGQVIPRRLHCLGWLRPELEIRPQRASEKSDFANMDGLVFQKTNVAAPSLGPASLQQRPHVAAVKLMVAHDIDDRLFGKMPLRPLNALMALVNVARQNHRVRVRFFWRIIPKFQM